MNHKIQRLTFVNEIIDYFSNQVLTRCSSPEEETQTSVIFRGEDKSDDVFAFGTLLFHLFSSRLPLAEESQAVVAAKIRAGNLPRSLGAIQCTERLKRLIQRCWDYESSRRPTFAQMVPHFAPGNCLLRRHSTSEPGLDQIGKALPLVVPTGGPPVVPSIVKTVCPGNIGMGSGGHTIIPLPVLKDVSQESGTSAEE